MYVVDHGNNIIRTISPNTRPITNFSASSNAVTRGQTLIIKSTSTEKPTAFKWTITPSSFALLNNSKLTDSVLFLNFTQTGTYTVKLWIRNSAGTDSLLRNAYISVSSVTALPIVDFKASKTIPLLNEKIDLIDLSANEPTAWKWRITPPTYIWQDGTDSTSRIPKIKFTNGNNYNVTLFVTNAQGTSQLTKTSYIMVNVSSINDIRKYSALNVYPNPANESIVVKDVKVGKLSLIDFQGKVLNSFNVNEIQNIELNTTQLQNGYYLLVWQGAEGVYSKKILIAH